jgi:hypothetical protein
MQFHVVTYHSHPFQIRRYVLFKNTILYLKTISITNSKLDGSDQLLHDAVTTGNRASYNRGLMVTTYPVYQRTHACMKHQTSFYKTLIIFWNKKYCVLYCDWRSNIGMAKWNKPMFNLLFWRDRLKF